MTHLISEMMDGELRDGECVHGIGRLCADVELRRSWEIYHLIGDVLRGDVTQAYGSNVPIGLSDEIAPILAANERKRSARTWATYGASLAAGIAAIALVASLAKPQATPNAEIARNSVVDSGAGINAARPEAALEDFNEYLLAHKRYSAAGTLQSMPVRVTTVSGIVEKSGQ